MTERDALFELCLYVEPNSLNLQWFIRNIKTDTEFTTGSVTLPDEFVNYPLRPGIGLYTGGATAVAGVAMSIISIKS